MPCIQSIAAREVLDSRGWPTVEADLRLDSGVTGRASVPSGASTGSHEAAELRDNDSKRYLGRGVQRAVSHISSLIAAKMAGFPAGSQREFDRLLTELDGTEGKQRLGANAILAVSLSYARASALGQGVPFFEYLACLSGREGRLLPTPMMNVINGGRHADNDIDIQEFMIIPCGPSFRESLRMGAEIFQHLKKILQSSRLSTSLGDEGGFAPALHSSEEGLNLMCEAVQKAGYVTGTDVFFALDVASTELYCDGRYRLKTEEGLKTSPEELTAYYGKLCRKYPIVSIEDGFSEGDWEGWVSLTRSLGQRVQLVGDDLFVTDPKRLERGIREGAANAVLIKPNQIGTLSETLETVRVARGAGYRTILSHRSGETEDTSIADLSVGCEAGQIKTGGLSRSERLAKYNQLLRIEEALGSMARYSGKASFSGPSLD